MFADVELPDHEYAKVYVDVHGWDNAYTMIMEKLKEFPNKKKVAFMCGGDGFIREFDKLSGIINRIVSNTDILKEHIVLVIGSMCVQNTIDVFNECVATRNWDKDLPIIIENAWEVATRYHMNEDYNIIFDSTPRIKDKFMLFFNGEARPDRGFMLANLLKHDLVGRAFVSAYHTVDYYLNDIWLTLDHSDAKEKTGLTNDLIEQFIIHRDKFPIELNRTGHLTTNSNSFHTKNDNTYFNNSYFSLVHETIFYKDSYNGFGHIPTLFLTEKTYKVISAKHPFIVAQRPGILAALRNEGYKTFSPFIDETYDTIEDDVSRLHAIKDEILRLSTYSDDQWIKFQHDVKSIVDHNFDLLMSRNTHRYRRIVNDGD